jgi:hypothetical protein
MNEPDRNPIRRQKPMSRFFSFFYIPMNMNKTITFLSVGAVAALAAFTLSTGLNTSASEVDTNATATKSVPEHFKAR